MKSNQSSPTIAQGLHSIMKVIDRNANFKNMAQPKESPRLFKSGKRRFQEMHTKSLYNKVTE
jgi:hypothetical protein